MSISKDKKKATCKFCGEPFLPNRPWQKFCSPKCRMGNFETNNPRVKREVK